MKLFPNRFKCAFITILCYWTSDSPFAHANYSINNENVVNSGNFPTMSLLTASSSATPAQPGVVGESILKNETISQGFDCTTGDDYNSDRNSADSTLDNRNNNPSPNDAGKTDFVLPHLIGRTKLPKDGDTWGTIQKENLMFVDKTKFLLYFVDRYNKLYFSGKPPRFGKTLFLQMIASFFRGEKNNFNGTYVFKYGNTREKNGTWIQYPVISIDFNQVPLPDLHLTSAIEVMKCLYSEIENTLRRIATNYEINTTMFEMFSLTSLIECLKHKFHLPVVILIDEYDSIMNKAINTHNQDVLSERLLQHADGFYRQIKGCSVDVKLALLTGVHKYDISSSQSGPNSFVDISWDPEFATSFGFTREEIQTTFKSHIQDFAAHLNKTPDYILNEMCTWYDGYNFGYDTFGRNAGDNVYNPISVLTTLNEFKFGVHCSKTSSSECIVEQMYEHSFCVEMFENFTSNCFDLEQKFKATVGVPLPKYMLHTGYLKIISYDKQRNVAILNYPNLEIKKHLEYEIETFIPNSKKSLYDEGEELSALRSSLQTNPPNMSRAVQLLNELSFPMFHHLSEQVLCEYVVTKRLCKIFDLAGIKYNHTTRRKPDTGGIDILTTSFKINYAIEINVKNDTAAAFTQILGYFTEKYEAIQFEDRIYILILAFSKQKNANITSWVLLPCSNKTILENEIMASNEELIANVTKHIEGLKKDKQISTLKH